MKVSDMELLSKNKFCQFSLSANIFAHLPTGYELKQDSTSQDYGRIRRSSGGEDGSDHEAFTKAWKPTGQTRSRAQRRLAGSSTPDTGRKSIWSTDKRGPGINNFIPGGKNNVAAREPLGQSFVQVMNNDALEGLNRMRFPTARDMKLAKQPFDGEEVYLGLGVPFTRWGHRFLRQLSYAQQASGGF